VAHFNASLHGLDLEELPFRLNQLLPKEIAIHMIQRVKPEAHARFDALSRTYEYHIASIKTPFSEDLVYTLYQPLDLELMNEAASLLLAYTDFECFSKSHTDVKTFLCTLSQAQWHKTEKGYVFTISANRFLRNMVRAIVGTLLEIGLHKKKCDDLHTIIKSKNRSLAGYSVPAQGLFLTHIEYPKTLYIWGMAKISGSIFDVKLFSKLMHFVKPFKSTYYFVLITAILLSLFSTVTPYLLKVTVDDYIRPKDYPGMVMFVGLMLIALLLEVLFQFLFVFYANWLGQKVIKNLRVDKKKKAKKKKK
jgi:tRNA pseudouridine38-40 synthase